MAIFNSVLKETGSEERAFKAANAILNKERKMESVFYFSTLDPDRLPYINISRVGSWPRSPWGPIEITEKDIDDIIKNFQEMKRDVVIDFRHGSGGQGKPEEGIAAGWIRHNTVKCALEKRPGGKGVELWALSELTDRSKSYVENKEYQFNSMEFHPDYPNPESGLKQGMTLLANALTNRPFIDGLRPILCSLDIDIDEINPIAMEAIDGNKHKRNPKHSKIKEVNEDMDKLKDLATKLELNPQDDWGDEEYAVAFQGHVESIKLEAKPKEKITLENKEYTKEDVVKMQEELQDQGKTIGELVDTNKLMQAEKTADKLVQDEKILPKERDYVIELAQESDKLLEKFLATREDGSIVKLSKEIGSAFDGNDEDEKKTETVKLQDAVAEKMKKDENLTYGIALQSVISENPELAEQYNEEQLTKE